MSRFAEALAAGQAVVDATFAERIVVQPRQASEYVESIPRPGINEFLIKGIADLDGQTMGVTGTRYKAKIDGNLMGHNAVVSVLTSQFDDALRPRPVKGDHLKLIERPGDVVFVVGAVRPDGQLRLHIYGELMSQ